MYLEDTGSKFWAYSRRVLRSEQNLMLLYLESFVQNWLPQKQALVELEMDRRRRIKKSK